MRFLIIDTYYPAFLQSFYASHPDSLSRSYQEHQSALMAACFGASDFYSTNFKKLGHEAWEVIANNDLLQNQWAKENGIKIEDMGQRELARSLPSLRGLIPPLIRMRLRQAFPFMRQPPRRRGFYEILVAQIKQYRPDVLFVQDMSLLDNDFLSEVKGDGCFIVGYIGCSLPQSRTFNSYDLVFSQLPQHVEYFRQQGIASNLLHLAFEPSVLEKLSDRQDKSGIVHVGGYSAVHVERIRLLQDVCRKFDIDCWGYGVENLPRDSAIRKNYRGQAWGLEMYRLLSRSKMTLNVHGEISGVVRFAGNMRLFEATGVGTLLITDWKPNLPELFEPGKEVVAYRTPEECAELIEYFLEHGDEREAIARAGQQRTLREHSYYQRMQELVDIVRKYV